MKTTRPDSVRFPRLYQVYKNTQEIADVINRSQSYVKKALRKGFTDREKFLIGQAKQRTDLFEEGLT